VVDAVQELLDTEDLCLSPGKADSATLHVYSAAPDRGQQWNSASIVALEDYSDKGWSLLSVAGDGLSSMAVRSHAEPVLERLRAALSGVELKGRSDQELLGSAGSIGVSVHQDRNGS